MVSAAPTTTTPAPPSIDLGPVVHELIHALLLLWPLGVLVTLVWVGRLALAGWKTSRFRRSGMHDIDRMDGPTFERRLAFLFTDLGYRAEVVGRAGDFGADLVATKDRCRTVVQAKCWHHRPVGVAAVQEVVGARGYYSADDAIVVTNSTFTAQAKELAVRNDVELWDREKLTSVLLEARPKRVAEPAASQSTVEADKHSPFCARCGVAVSEKVHDYCRKHPARFGGLVYCYDHQRTVSA